MGNNNHEPYQVNRFIEAPSLTTNNINQNHQTHRPSNRPIGLRPTNANQDSVYQRSHNARASKRSHNERRSYLMATGHLNREEAVCLTSSLIDTQQSQLQTSHSPSRNTNLQSSSNSYNTSHSGHKSAGDQLQLINPLSYSDQFDTIENQFHNLSNNNIFSSHNGTSNNNKKSKSYNSSNIRNSNRNSKRYNNNNNNSSGNFERSYTEVTLPMKTSPAFEYLLHNDKRKYKRTILCITYICLITTCLGIIYYYSSLLKERLNHNL